MSEQYSKITINQLDIDAVADYVVQSKKLVYRDGELLASDTNAMDTDKVAGIESGNIAVSIDKEHRDTVNNALNLGGLPASEYLTSSTGSSLISGQMNVKKSYGDDIKDLRDELYQLRNELVKSGIVNNNGQYEGFTDSFRRNHYINIQEMIGTANTVNAANNNEIIVDNTEVLEQLKQYDFICIYNRANAVFDIKQIANINTETKVVTLDSDLRSVVRSEEVELYRSKGIIHDGLYKFATDAENQVGTEEFHTGLSDDTYNVTKRINQSNTGFGTSFRVPAAKQGFVTSIEICAKAYGAPGALMAYILDTRDLEKFLNPALAKTEYEQDIANENPDGWHFFAQSQPYTLEASQGKRYINFNFQQEDGSYPLMTRDEDGVTVRYILVIEALDVNSSNYYDIVFLQHQNASGTMGDLELNNISYIYTRRSDNSVELALNADEELNKYDMYYHITTRGVTENEPEAQKQGLYTAHYQLQNVKSDFTAAKARLMLRVKREGEWKVVTDSSVPKVYTSEVINVVNTNDSNNIKNIEDLRLKSEIYKRIEERDNELEISEQGYTIIGNNITKIQGIDVSTVTSNNPVLLSNGDKIYRCGYLVSINAREISFDSETGDYIIGPWDHYVMPLTQVFKDLEPVNNEYSDRLIFECDLVGQDLAVKKYNDFELQIFWENRELSSYSDIKSSQMGAVKDLVLSFARGF